MANHIITLETLEEALAVINRKDIITGSLLATESEGNQNILIGMSLLSHDEYESLYTFAQERSLKLSIIPLDNVLTVVIYNPSSMGTNYHTEDDVLMLLNSYLLPPN